MLWQYVHYINNIYISLINLLNVSCHAMGHIQWERVAPTGGKKDLQNFEERSHRPLPAKSVDILRSLKELTLYHERKLYHYTADLKKFYGRPMLGLEPLSFTRLHGFLPILFHLLWGKKGNTTLRLTLIMSPGYHNPIWIQTRGSFPLMWQSCLPVCQLKRTSNF